MVELTNRRRDNPTPTRQLPVPSRLRPTMPAQQAVTKRTPTMDTA